MISTRAKLTLSLTVVSMALGFMIAVQYRQQLQSHLTSGYSASDTEQKKLLAQLNALKQTNLDSQQQLAKLTSQLSTFEQQSAGSSSSLQDLQQRLQDERILAGTTAVTGPGVTVTLMDGAGSAQDAQQFLTHDWEVRSVINELFTAGAEAISINGYRVVATSGVFCSGPVVRVNDHRIAAPFVIEAIGNPQTLKTALTMPGGALDYLRMNSGIKVSDPQIEQTIKMSAFTGALTGSSTN